LTPSQHGQLAQDYVVAFAPVVLDAFRPPDRWPDAIVLDSKPIPFTLTTRHPNGTITSQQAAYHLLGIHGYPAGRGSGRPWRIFVAGGVDGVEWERVLRSLPGTPSWVVCDDDKGIKAAVRSLWPNAVIHTCEGHLRRLLLDRLAADGQPPTSDFAYRASGALAYPGRWAAFVADANAAGLAHTSRWLAGKDRLMRRQFADRQPDRPYSNGAVETVFDAITQAALDPTVRVPQPGAARTRAPADAARPRRQRGRVALPRGDPQGAARRGRPAPEGASPARRPGRLLDPRRGARGHRADRCEGGAEREAREGSLQPEEGGADRPGEAPISPPSAGVQRDWTLTWPPALLPEPVHRSIGQGGREEAHPEPDG
jgi:hypothetical protein